MPEIPAGIGYMKSVSGSPQEAQLQDGFSPIGGQQGWEGPAGGNWADWEARRGPSWSRASKPFKIPLLWKEQQPWRDRAQRGNHQRKSRTQLYEVEQVTESNEETHIHTHVHLPHIHTHMHLPHIHTPVGSC